MKTAVLHVGLLAGQLVHWVVAHCPAQQLKLQQSSFLLQAPACWQAPHLPLTQTSPEQQSPSAAQVSPAAPQQAPAMQL